LANRQILTHLVRESFREIFPKAELPLLFDVSHNTCKLEEHLIDGHPRSLFVHRKGATRAFGPGHVSVPSVFKKVGQPVLIGGTMGTASYILTGTATDGKSQAFGLSMRGVAEEAPGAYKDVSAVVEAADQANLARKVAKLHPVICIKG
jgi:tRNA-splicing ligase RtcB